MAGKQLQDIKTFPELVGYLRDELNFFPANGGS